MKTAGSTRAGDWSTEVRPAGDGDRIAREARARWAQGEIPDVSRLLAERPELWRQRSIALDLAYEEYCHRVKSGECIDPEGFSRRFPPLQRSLQMLIMVQNLLSHDPLVHSLQEQTAWPESGEEFLGFTLIAELGRGTFARVFLASEAALGRRLVTVKITPGGGNEATILGKLDHPNIVPVHSVQEDPETGLTAVCMPYLGRATLADVLDQVHLDGGPPRRATMIRDLVAGAGHGDPHGAGRLAPAVRRGSYIDSVLFFAAELAGALAHAHARGICHRDLKPSNVLLSQEARPLLLDFNLSHDGQSDVVRCGGTLPYMAPEELRAVALGTNHAASRPDPRSDLYALGVITYELLTGRLPFEVGRWEGSLRDAAAELLAAQDKGPAPLLRRNRNVDRSAAQWVHACLALTPESRPHSAEQLRSALERQLRWPRRARRWVRGHRTLAAGLGAIVLGGTVLAGVSIASREPYPVRQYRQGLACSERGEYDAAIDCFDRAIRADPANFDALMARVKVHFRQRRWVLANADLEKASELQPTPEVAALQGYCLNRLRFNGPAIISYKKAIADGIQSAAVFNNLAFSYWQVGQFEEAEKWSIEALRADGSSMIAHHVMLRVYRDLFEREPAYMRRAVAAADRAQATGPLTADGCYEAALIYAGASRFDRRQTDKALRTYQCAAELGYRLASMAESPLEVRIKGRPEYQELRARKVSVKRVSIDYLMEPQ